MAAYLVDEDEVEDVNLKLLTVAFRPFLVENLHLTSEILSNLHSRNALNHEIMGNSEQLLREASPVNVLLLHLAELNNKGVYRAFIECLRATDNDHIADTIEGISSIEDQEFKEFWMQLVQVYHNKLIELEPSDALDYLQCLSREEKEVIRQTTSNHGSIRGAVALLGILPKKSNDGFGQLMEALRETGHGELAKELAGLHCPPSKCGSGATCENNLSLTDVEMETCSARNTYTGVMVDKLNVFDGCTPMDDTSGIDSSCCQENEKWDPALHNNVEIESSNSSLRLRSYQEELVAASLQGKNSVVVAPTGSGKTFIAARLVKAFVEREDGVGQRVGVPSQVIRHGSNKVVFLVPKVPLVEQQSSVLRRFMSDSSIMGLSGDMGDCGPLVDLLDRNDILVMTPQILVNALHGNREDNERMELSRIGLLVLDECHHCQKGNPYNIVMSQYCDLKLMSPDTARPQVLGLTASMGVGRASSHYEAETHVLTMCANLDAEVLCTVQDPRNKMMLKTIRDKPEEEIFTAPGRKNDGFVKEINSIMDKIERIISLIPGGDKYMKTSMVPKRGTQAYENWLVGMEKYFVEEVGDENRRRRLMTCKDHLKEYNTSLYINRDARTHDALGHLEQFKNTLVSGTTVFTDDEEKLMGLFTAKKPKLMDLATSENPDLQNPLLLQLANILKKYMEDGKSRGILFCKMRATAKALHAWLQESPDLTFMQAGVLTGSKGSDGMTQAQQDDVLEKFRSGKHRLLVATSVAEEGLDIQECNIVVRCNYVSDEIGRVQAQGRSRARGGKFYSVVSEELSYSNRMIRNCIREKMMDKATDSINSMHNRNQQEFLEKIIEIQKKSQQQRLTKELALARLKDSRKKTDVRLLCRKCSCNVCTLDDIRCVENAHRVVLDPTFTKKCRLVPHNKPVKTEEFEKLKKVLCGDKACSQEWGIQMKYKACIVYALTPPNFIFQMVTGKRREFRKWRDVSYVIADISEDELFNLVIDWEEASDDENDDGGNIWMPS